MGNISQRLEETMKILNKRTPKLCGGMHELRGWRIRLDMVDDPDGLRGVCPENVRQNNALCAHNYNGKAMTYSDAVGKLLLIVQTDDERQKLLVIEQTLEQIAERIRIWDEKTSSCAFLHDTLDTVKNEPQVEEQFALRAELEKVRLDLLKITKSEVNHSGDL